MLYVTCDHYVGALRSRARRTYLPRLHRQSVCSHASRNLSVRPSPEKRRRTPDSVAAARQWSHCSVGTRRRVAGTPVNSGARRIAGNTSGIR